MGGDTINESSLLGLSVAASVSTAAFIIAIVCEVMEGMRVTFGLVVITLCVTVMPHE